VVLLGPRGLVLRCRIAGTVRERLRGLLGSRRLAPDEALLLPDATSVHTVGMRFPLLVARLDAELRVLDVRATPPGRMLTPLRTARHVLECSVEADLRPGDRLRESGTGTVR
jgi:uncharacterized membrane protein (UPF0127 family)